MTWLDLVLSVVLFLLVIVQLSAIGFLCRNSTKEDYHDH